MICTELSFLRDPKASRPVNMSAVLIVDKWMCLYYVR